MNRSTVLLLVACAIAWTGLCAGESETDGSEEACAMAMELTSRAFTAGQRIPIEHTCEGDNVSPVLSWWGAPDATVSFALIMDDPDAPSGTFVHWVLYNLPADTDSLPRDVPKTEGLSDGSLQGVNSARRTGYLGPCPPRGHGRHRYVFKLYALDSMLNAEAAVTKERLLALMESHVLAEARLMGTYSKE